MSRVLRKLSVETFVLTLADEIARLPDLTTFALRQRDSTTFEVDVSSDQSINDLFAALTDAGLRVVSMRNKSNRLEELFLRLVDSKEPVATAG